ncbi:MAG TPA: hypothetical protein VGO90_07180 [Chthoniobacteraceae bacterium]|jgi:hypothetical protein|nr:hypothetical protein [Chthoniobacter sp.]HEV7867447.1 hypothetical protein [Chthoniobacteraceae bacterium]
MNKNNGSTMLVVLMVLGALSACIIASLNFTSVIGRDVQRSNTLRQAIEVGDGALDYAFAHWRQACRAQTNVQLPTSSLSAIRLPSASLFPSIPNFTASRDPNPPGGTPYTLANYKVVAVDQNWVPLANTAAPSPPAHGMSLGTADYSYLATVDVTLPAVGPLPIAVKMRRIFTKSLISPWNYAIFYVDDLEMHPGPLQNITGWVHSNSRLYTGHSSLTFQSKVSYGDDWFKGFKPGDPRVEVPTNPNLPANLPPFRDQGQQPFGLDSGEIFSSTDVSPNNDSYRELVEVPKKKNADGTIATDPIGEARYYNQAGIKITVDEAGTPAGTVIYRREDGTVINNSSTGNDKKLFLAFSSAITVGATITDKREAATVRLIDVNVATLNTHLSATGAPPFNGIAYISDQSGSATVKRAIRLKNGATIARPGGLTFATDNGLYIQGDYNTGRTTSAEPPSNTGTSTSPTVAGYIRKPCAVVADAVMVLSNNWLDTNSASSLSSRLASNTTVNTAIVSGIVPTTGTAANPGDYSGGAENFPRFLERWTGDTLTYYGSMVELYTSKQFNTPWKNTGSGPNVYDAPDRKWYFDTNFYTSPPPGSLMVISYKKSRWYLE